MIEFTARELCTAIERELRFRRRVYPRFVSDGKMKQSDADTQIAAFEAIRTDYHTKAEEEEKKDRLL